MSISTGGRADKLGGRYEGLWVAHNLIRLVAEELREVQLELVGDEGRGVDLWVRNNEAVRTAQQCKRKNRTVGHWTIGELASQGVLGALAFQLRRDPSVQFTFISGHPAAELKELTETAATCGDDPDAFFEETLKLKARAGGLRRFCAAVDTTETTADGRREAFDFLKRTSVTLFDDSAEGRGFVQTICRCHIGGDPASVIEVLASFAVDQMGNTITTEIVRRLLLDRGFTFRRLAGDARVADRLEVLRAQFRDSLQSSLINSVLVNRPECQMVLETIQQESGPRLVLVHGRAGSGKSCVLLELAERLEGLGIAFLPIRLDRRCPRTSASYFGTEVCDLPESPAVTLNSFYPSRRAVLILDQLDAVRWTATHASAQWEACQEVIDEALRLPNLFVVVACRTFDLRDDQQIHSWHSRRKGREIELGELAERTVTEIVNASGRDYEQLTPRQRSMLRTPLLLSLWTQLVAQGSGESGWNSQSDLMRAFWKSRYAALESLELSLPECQTVLDEIVAEMDRRGRPSVPSRLLDSHPKVAAALKSLHVLVASGSLITFAHQSQFEYLFAVRLLNDVRRGAHSVCDWLRSSDQTLMRREQLRLVLTLLRDEDAEQYVKTFREIVNGPDGIRFHLKQLMLRLLGDLPDPSPAERQLVLELAEREPWQEHLIDQIASRQVIWFEVLCQGGLIERWLRSASERLTELALNIIRWWSRRHGNLVATLLGPFFGCPDPWPHRLASALPFDPLEDSENLFALRLRLIRAGVCKSRFLFSKELTAQRPDRAVDLLIAHLEQRENAAGSKDASPREVKNFPYYLAQFDAESLEPVIRSEPDAVWNRTLPFILTACERHLHGATQRKNSLFLRDSIWNESDRINRFANSIELPAILAKAGAILIGRDPTSFSKKFEAVFAHRAETIQYLAGLVLANADTQAADVAIGWLCECPGRLGLRDDRGGKWGMAARIIRRHAADCSEGVYRNLEAALLRFHDADEKSSVEWKVRSQTSGLKVESNRYGLAQHALLPGLPEDRLSDSIRSEIGVLSRKFLEPADAFSPNRSRMARTVVGPIPVKRVEKISDLGWLEIIRYAAREEDCYERRPGGSHARLTARDYANQLGQAAGRNPQRFADLLLQLSPRDSLEYVTALLHSVSASSPPTADMPDWNSIRPDQVLAVIRHVGFQTEREVGKELCWFVRERHELLADQPDILALLGRYATDHPDPACKDKVVWRGEAEIDYDAAAINCTRGIALQTIERLLFDFPRLFPAFESIVRRAILDPSPIIRVAAAGTCLPILNIDRGLAVELFLTSVSGVPQVLASHHIAEFIRYALSSHFPQLEALLNGMAKSETSRIATEGATWLTCAWIVDLTDRETVETYVRGNPAQRLGAARAAAHNCVDETLVERCVSLLDTLIHDADPAVQEVVVDYLRGENPLRYPAIREFTLRYISGPSFPAQPIWLLDALHKYPDSLIPLAPIFGAICGRLASDLADTVRARSSRNSYDLDRFVPLLLRLYEQSEQAQDFGLRTECLNWWDSLLQSRIGEAINMIERIDQGL